MTRRFGAAYEDVCNIIQATFSGNIDRGAPEGVL